MYSVPHQLLCQTAHLHSEYCIHHVLCTPPVTLSNRPPSIRVLYPPCTLYSTSHYSVKLPTTIPSTTPTSYSVPLQLLYTHQLLCTPPVTLYPTSYSVPHQLLCTPPATLYPTSHSVPHQLLCTPAVTLYSVPHQLFCTPPVILYPTSYSVKLPTSIPTIITTHYPVYNKYMGTECSIGRAELSVVRTREI